MQGELDVLVVGGANTDFLVRGRALPRPGTTIEGGDFQQGPGGKGANQAVAAARLGASVAFLGRVGDDERGRALVEALGREHVRTDLVTLDPGAPTGAALVMVDSKGEKQILTAPGANHRVTPADLERARPLVANARVVLAQLELPLETVEAAVNLARAAGAHVVLDPAPAHPLPEALLVAVHVIRPNAAEAEVLTGVEVTDHPSARLAAENLMRRGVGAAVVGAPGGDLVLSSDGELWLPHLPVEVVDATGAGDAFAAALAVALARGQNLAHAAHYARATAALATTKLGAQAGLPSHDEVVALLREESLHEPAESWGSGMHRTP